MIEPFGSNYTAGNPRDLPACLAPLALPLRIPEISGNPWLQTGIDPVPYLFIAPVEFFGRLKNDRQIRRIFNLASRNLARVGWYSS